MNILFIAGTEFKPRIGGVAEYTHQLCKHLERIGHNVLVFSSAMENDENFDRSCHYNVSRFDYWKLMSGGKLYNVIKRCLSIFRVAKKHRPQVIICNVLQGEAFIGWVIARALKVPFFICAHGRELTKRYGFLKRTYRKPTLKWADAVFANSNFTKNLLEKVGVSSHKIVVVFPGVDLDEICTEVTESDLKAISSLGLEGRKIILTLGRLEKRKGFDTVIRAMQAVSKEIPDSLYVIAGDGAYRTDLEQLIMQLGLQNYVRLVGAVDDSMKHLYYKAASLFVMPNRELVDGDIEGFGIVFLEAAAYSKPVVAGNSGGAVDAVVHGKTGILINPNDVKELENVITALFKDDALARKLGHQAWRRVKDDLTWKNSAGVMSETLQTFLARSESG
ncbi:MAG: glycosyltransferase family 4 protein [Nitrososphaera sp.]|nr:glycosyltransferase family 4 protein [Nitrososphaera sp.]